MHAARMTQPVPIKSFPIVLLRTAQIFDPISYLILRASFNNAQKDPVITHPIVCLTLYTLISDYEKLNTSLPNFTAIPIILTTHLRTGRDKNDDNYLVVMLIVW